MKDANEAARGKRIRETSYHDAGHEVCSKKERRTHTGQHKTVDNTQTQEGIQRANTASSENAGRHATYDNHEGASINSTFKHSEG